jgi:hypothetical protein
MRSDLCQAYLQLVNSNCLQYLNLAYKFRLKSLRVHAMEHFFANKKKILDSKPDVAQWEFIPKDVLEALDLLISSSDD